MTSPQATGARCKERNHGEVQGVGEVKELRLQPEGAANWSFSGTVNTAGEVDVIQTLTLLLSGVSARCE